MVATDTPSDYGLILSAGAWRESGVRPKGWMILVALLCCTAVWRPQKAAPRR